MPPMAVRPLLLLLLLLLLFLSTTATSATDNTTTLNAYEVLQTYNFPIGLLPKGVLGYDLDPVTGKFAAYFDGTCNFNLEGSYDIQYKSTISGYISNSRLSSLQGVSVKILLFWISIIEVTRVDDELQFSVGIASANFPISNFVVSPRCGCGMDCVSFEGGDGAKLRANI